MSKLTDGLLVIRYHVEDLDALEECIDGDEVSYSAMQHHYRECLEHGNTLEEAIRLMEEKNGT